MTTAADFRLMQHSLRIERMTVIASMLGLLALTTLLSLRQPLVTALPAPAASATSTPKHSRSLAQYALEKVLSNASPVFGDYNADAANITANGLSTTCRWYVSFPWTCTTQRLMTVQDETIFGRHAVSTYEHPRDA
nr:hypothetical protein CFP56_52386 [Quercus suber]